MINDLLHNNQQSINTLGNFYHVNKNYLNVVLYLQILNDFDKTDSSDTYS